MSCAHISRRPQSGTSPKLSCNSTLNMSPASQRLHAVVSTYTEAAKRFDPFYASTYNVEKDLNKFGDFPTPEYFARMKNAYKQALSALKTVDFKSLPENDRQLYRLFKEDMTVSLKGFDYPDEYLAFNQMDNRLLDYLNDSSESLTTFPFDSVKHYEDFVERSKGLPLYVDRQIAELRRGIKKGIVLSCNIVAQVPNTYEDALEPDVEKNPFWRPMTFMPKTFSAADQMRLKAEFRKMIATRIVPGYKKFDRFFKEEYSPHCRHGFGLASLPHAKSWYEQEILANTNLNLTPPEIHEMGLEEVARIKGEIEAIRKQLGFKGTYKQFLASLLHDPKYFFKTRDDMFHAFERVKGETARRVPKYFSLMPKSDFKIVETSNPNDAAGSYNPPTEMLPYGRFIVNTKNLRSVPIYEVTTLMLHETVPGHHFQLALQFEMKDKLTEYQRKLFNSNSFVEGWALYAEYLGNEMGMYKDPLQRLGNLNDDMLRAVRLVVDTGIHYYGWSQARARAYMRQYLANDEKDIDNEVNRYAVWPGQALAYKLGQLKILELRHLAKRELGSKFDIKQFHAAVIGHGTVSLTELDKQVKDWIARAKTGSTAMTE